MGPSLRLLSTFASIAGMVCAINRDFRVCAICYVLCSLCLLTLLVIREER